MTITGAISGGNPSSPDAIKLAGGAYRIVPWSEDGDHNYKFQLLVEIRNAGADPAVVPIEIDWAETKYAYLRDHLYASTSAGWVLIRGEIDGPVIRAELNCPPGRTLLSLHPAYRSVEHGDLLKRAVLAGARHQVVGKSGAGRDIDLLRFGQSGDKRDRLLVIARLHPYETAGSYCAEGIVAELSGSAAGRELLDRFEVAVVPMCNPDGVEGGLCKRVAAGGPNPEKGLNTGDPTAGALKRAVDEVRPTGLLDIHGWMHRDVDGFSIYDRSTADRFAGEFRQLSQNFGPPREWREGDHTKEPSDSTDLRHYARDAHGAKVVVLSFGWDRRSLGDMQGIGAAALRAFARAVG